MGVIVLSLREAHEVNVQNNGDSLSVCLSASPVFNLAILTPVQSFVKG